MWNRAKRNQFIPVVDFFPFTLRFSGSLSNTTGTGTGIFTFNDPIIPFTNDDYFASPLPYTDQTGDGMTADDTFAAPNITYAGFQLVTPAGNFAVFIEPGSGPFPDVYYVPHDGNLASYPVVFSIGSLPSEDYVFASGNQPANYCLLAGTRIATPDGDRPVETLQPGDLVCGPDGRAMPVTWNGRQTVSTRFGPADRLRPVCIKAGALGDGLPTRDLYVTADHALLVDDVLINAGALVNDTSIRFVPLSAYSDSYILYSIELDRHEILLAEGAPVESFVDYAGRRGLDNYSAYLAVYGTERAIAELDIPRISAARLVPNAIRQRLSALVAA